MGVEEKRAIGERKLESSIGSVFRTATVTIWPVWRAGPVRMMRSARMVRLVWVIGPVRVVGFVGMAGLMGRGVTRGLGLMRRGMVRGIGMMGRGMTGIRMVRRLGATVFAVAVGVPHHTGGFNLLRLRPISVFVTFQSLAGIETGLRYQSVPRFCWVEAVGSPIGNPEGRC